MFLKGLVMLHFFAAKKSQKKSFLNMNSFVALLQCCRTWNQTPSFPIRNFFLAPVSLFSWKERPWKWLKKDLMLWKEIKDFAETGKETLFEAFFHSTSLEIEKGLSGIFCLFRAASNTRILRREQDNETFWPFETRKYN